MLPEGPWCLPLSNVLVPHNFGVFYSLPPQVHELLEGTDCLSVISGEPGPGLVVMMLVERMFKPSSVD